MPEITVGGETFDADAVEAALDELDDETRTNNDVANADGDIVVFGDGYADEDVFVMDIERGIKVGIVKTSALRDKIEEARPNGPFLKAESSGGSYGFKIPLDDVSGNVEIELDEAGYGNPHQVAWNTAVDKSDMQSDGAGAAESDDPDLDGHAVVETVEVVDS